MIEYSKQMLPNGLSVIIHEDKSTPLVAINVLYKVGSKDEDPDRTGYAHLFEHLMFGGTKNIPDFDAVIQNAGGENNAFTNCDITNYYNVVPAENLEVALWLEADRMMNSHFTKKGLEIQKKVVVEEFKETCLNEPYGDLWHHLAPMAYKNHAYQWPTIGKDINHIKKASLLNIQEFFDCYYAPNNAILVLTGNIEVKRGFELAEKWFGGIIPKDVNRRNSYIQNNLDEPKLKIIKSNVPLKSLTWAFPMGDRLSENYYAADLLSDILGSGRSSRFYTKLLKSKSVCNTTDAFISGTNDPGLFIMEHKLNSGVELNAVKELVWEELDRLKTEYLGERELQKIKNKAESNLIFSETSTLNKAISLAYYESLGQIELINDEVERYQEISVEDLKKAAEEIFDKEKMIELVYEPIG